MTEKVSERLQNDCLACYLVKNLIKLKYNGNYCILNDVWTEVHPQPD